MPKRTSPVFYNKENDAKIFLKKGVDA